MIASDMKVAIYQPDARPLTLGQRLQMLEVVLENNKKCQAELVLCPELFLSGYGNADEIRRLACPVGSDSIELLANIARQYGIAIACGYPEQSGNHVYNSVLCLSAQGELIANHRKRVLPTVYEQNLFQRGQDMTLFDLDNGWRVALLLCYEVEFPEAVRASALAGAHLVLVPTALGCDWRIVSRQLVPTRAFENGVFLAYANFSGEDEASQYIGDSVIVSPTGEDMARAGSSEAFIYAELDRQAIDRARVRLPFLKDYTELLS